jgi:hypothetical protein
MTSVFRQNDVVVEFVVIPHGHTIPFLSAAFTAASMMATNHPNLSASRYASASSQVRHDYEHDRHGPCAATFAKPPFLENGRPLPPLCVLMLLQSATASPGEAQRS